MEESTNGGNPSQNTENMESKKPSILKQQRLTACEPILSAGTVFPTILVIGILFIPVGIGLRYYSDSVKEVTIPYTCSAINDSNNRTCADIIKNASTSFCQCEVLFTLDTQFSPKVFMYYALTNFYQNHRRYIKSRDDDQLWGYSISARPNPNCDPFAYNKKKVIYPCGAVANSMFSDEIALSYHQSEGTVKPVSLIRTGIAWESDKKFKFKNPENYSKNAPMWKNHTKPKAWRKQLWELDPDDPDNNGIQNEDFIVWMRTEALPNFRKLYRIVDANAEGFRGGLPPGNYSLKINYTYEVESFHGTKSIVLSTTSLLGGKNLFLGIAYIVVGTMCLILEVFVLFIHFTRGKSTLEMADVDPTTPWIAK